MVYFILGLFEISSFDLSSIEKDYTDTDGTTLTRQPTQPEIDVAKRRASAHALASTLHEKTFDVDTYLPPFLQGAIFVGHLVTDMDSIAGAIGAAELYGGIPARASNVNSETDFCLKYWGLEPPNPIEEILDLIPQAGVCLVDHQQMSQLNKAINVDRIVGVIDHHALQNATIVTDKPIYIDIRPWGSMSSIIAHNFFTSQVRPSKSTAGMLLCAILSDTLNLMGPTTTDWDRSMVAILCEIAEVDDIQLLASQQFKAKSRELAGLTAPQLCNGDQKCFAFKAANFVGSVGFAVIETTDDEVIMARKAELIIALSEDKAEKKLEILYLAVVNIVELRSSLICLGPAEFSLAKTAFRPAGYVHPADADPFVLDLGSLVSRKNDFIPAVTKAIKGGWGM